MFYLSLVSQYDKSVISPSIIAHLWNIQDIHQTEKLPTSCINCVSFEVIPILWAEKTPPNLSKQFKGFEE